MTDLSTEALERLRELLAKASEPYPTPLPEQDSRVGEAMAAQADYRNISAWRSRIDIARENLVNALPAFLAEIDRLRTPRQDLRENCNCGLPKYSVGDHHELCLFKPGGVLPEDQDDDYGRATPPDGELPGKGYTVVASPVPEGFALVPIKPTEAMIKIGAQAAFDADSHGDHWLARARAAWSAMLAAAPPVGLSSGETGK